MITLDWKLNRSEIMNRVKEGNSPFKVSTFLPVDQILPQSDEDVLSRFSDLKILTTSSNQKDFIEKIKHGLSPNTERREETIFSYRALIENDIDKRNSLKCYEDLIPEIFSPSISSIISETDLRQFLNSNYTEDYYYRFFYGLKGQTTSPHFDWSPFNNFLLQLYGEKEVILLDTISFSELSFYYNYLDYDFFELREFAEKNKIPYKIITIKSGEGLYIPPYWVHAVNYLTDTSSLSLRLLPMIERMKIQQVIPANFLLAFLLDKLPQRHLLTKDLVDQLLAIKKYSALVQTFDDLALKHFNLKVKHNQESLKYEEFMFQERSSFEFQLREKKRKLGIIARGCSYFSSL